MDLKETDQRIMSEILGAGPVPLQAAAEGVIPEDTVMDPRPEAGMRALATRPVNVAARRLVLFDNGKLSPPYLRWTPVIEPLLRGLRALGTVQQESADLLIEPVEQHAARVERWRAEGIDGVVFALCDAGVGSPTLLHAAAAEAAGIPTAVVCIDQLVNLLAAAAAFQAPGLPLVLLPAGRLDSTERIGESARSIVPEITRALTLDAPSLLQAFEQRFPFTRLLARHKGDTPPTGDDFASFAEERRLDDGLPVIAPQRKRVAALIEHVQREPGAVIISSVAPSGAPVTVESAAACAVMAGVRPAEFPFVLAALEAMAQPAYRLDIGSISTHPSGNLLLFSGPAADAAGIASGRGCLGPGQRVNLAIGRAVSLTLQNVGRAVPGISTLTQAGSPAQVACCFADRADGPWPALHKTLGTGNETVCMAFKCESPHNLMDHVSTTPESLMRGFCSVATTLGGNNAFLPSDLLLILNPEHADVIARAGWTRTEMRRFIWENARNDRASLAGHGGKPEWPEAWASWESLPVVPSSERIWIVVAGAGGPQSQVGIPWGYSSACWTVVNA